MLWQFFLNMYRTLVLFLLVKLIILIRLLKKGVQLVLAVDSHTVLSILFLSLVRNNREVRSPIRAIAFMIQSSILNWYFRLLTLLPYSCPHRLCLHF